MLYNCCMSAVRTQVYFTEEQRRRLDERSAREGKTMAEVVREAVDAYLDGSSVEAVNAAVAAAYGAIPDFEVPSREEEWAHRPTLD